MKKLISSILLVSMLNMFMLGSFAFCKDSEPDANNDSVEVKSEKVDKVEEFNDGKDEGIMLASSKHKTTGYIIGGVISGGLLGLIGTGLGVGIIAISSPPTMPPIYKAEINDSSKSYKKGFREGYGKKAKNKNLLSFLYSGLIGSLIAGVVIAAQSDK